MSVFPMSANTLFLFVGASAPSNGYFCCYLCYFCYFCCRLYFVSLLFLLLFINWLCYL